MHATQRLHEQIRSQETEDILLRRKIRALGDELYALTVDDADWERFWMTVAEAASLKEIQDALLKELERRKAPIVPEDPCYCQDVPDGSQCRFCAAKAAAVEVGS